MLDFSKVSFENKTLNVFGLTNDYATATPNGSFYNSYSINDTATIEYEDIEKFIDVLNDEANYHQSQSKGCSFVANYGFKVKMDDINYIFFVGNKPCSKLVKLNEKTLEEKIIDIKEVNTIIPFIEARLKN